jgi:hypothetical protein
MNELKNFKVGDLVWCAPSKSNGLYSGGLQLFLKSKDQIIIYENLTIANPPGTEVKTRKRTLSSDAVKQIINNFIPTKDWIFYFGDLNEK